MRLSVVPGVPPAVVVGAALVLVACGFQPRGTLVALDDPGQLFLDTDRGLSIEEDLRVALLDSAFSLAPNRDEADIVLRVADERQTQRILSVRSTGRVSEYELAHTVSVRVSRDVDPAAAADVDGGTAAVRESAVAPGGAPVDVPAAAPVTEPRRADQVQVTREYTYDESQVLGKENEARILKGEMGEELVRQIVLRTVASLARNAEDPG